MILLFDSDQWGGWSVWSVCTRTCDTGTQVRTRTCPTAGRCQGSPSDSRSCFIQSCPSGPGGGRSISILGGPKSHNVVKNYKMIFNSDNSKTPGQLSQNS